MKIYFDLAKKCLKEVDTENQVIFTGDVLVSKLEVISSAPTADYYVVVSAKLSNGRTIGPFLYDAGGVQTDSHCTKWTFTLSSANGFTLTKGIVNFYIWLVPVNANDLNKKCVGAVAVNVGEAYGFEDSYFVELDSESQDVIANMSAQIHQLQTLINNVNIIEPNPSSEATQILDKIKIGSVTYRFRSDYNELTNQPIKNVTLGANTTINDLLQAVDYDETLGVLNTSYLLKIKGVFSSPYDSKYLVGMSVRYYNNAVQNVILSQVNGDVVYSGTWSASDFDHTIYNPTSSTTYTFNEFLKYTSQSLTDAQKQQAQANIGVKDVIDAVNYNVGTDVMRPQVDEVNFADVDEVRINAGKTMLVDDDNEDEALLSSVLGGLDDGIADLESGKAKKIVATINNTTYVMTISLYADAEGTVLLSTATVDLPLESIITSATYYDSYTYGGTTYTKVIVLVLSTTSVPTIVPVGDLISGLQTEITPQNKLSSDLVDDSSSSLHKFVTADDKLVWNAKQDALTFDNVPTSGSQNPVKSGGVYSAIDSARQQATQDAVNILTSDNSFVQANLGATPVPDSIVELNGDLYSLWGVGQYKFNENTKQWETVSIPIGTNVNFARADILGSRIFKIGNSYYCAFNNATKGVAYLTSQMHWVQGTSNVVFDGATVWTDGTDTYAFVGNVSNADDAIIYRIVESSTGNLTLTDVTSSFTNIPTSYGGHKIALTKVNIWHDLDGNTFLSYGKTYKLIANTRTFDDREYFYGVNISQGNYVWNDGHNVFLTNGNTYVLNMTTETSTQLPIAGMESMNPDYGMYGNRIWKDMSGNVYYVDNSLHQFALVNGSFIDQAYDPTSKNAQSGIAVAEAVAEEQNRAISQENKSLYHLGAFDSADGKTRQTGVVDLDSLEWSLVQGDGYWFWQTSFVRGQKTASSSSEVVEGKHAIYNATSSNTYGSSNNTFYWSDANLIIRTTSTTEKPSGILQYKLATAYTEEVIEGESILPLDTTMANKIRQKVVDGLNLFDKDNPNLVYNTGYEPNPTSSVGVDWVKVAWIPVKPNTTYSVNKNIRYSFYNGNSWSSIGSSDVTTFTTASDTQYLLLIEYRGGTQTAEISKTAWANLMLVDINHPYPYEPYHANKHISDDEATLLKQEWEKGLNLWKGDVINGANIRNDGVIISDSAWKLCVIEVKANQIYTTSNNVEVYAFFTNKPALNSTSYNSTRIIENVGTFTSPIDGYVAMRVPTATTQFMINYDKNPYPYQEWNGKTLHQKDIEPTLLWQNGSPNSSFASQTITTADMSKYKYIVVEYKGNALALQTSFIKIRLSNTFSTEPIYYISFNAYVGGTMYSCNRNLTLNSYTSITFGDSYSNTYALDTDLIPIAIYGTDIL